VPSLGYVLVLGLLGVTTKLALDDLRWQELILWTAVAYAAIAAVLTVVNGQRLRIVPGAGYGLVSGILAATALIALFLALGAGEVSRVVPITSSYPVVTVLLAALMLRERVTALRGAATMLVVGGVILLSVG
jgi:transporter family protein